MSDVSVVRWRIDQQSELIMKLKTKLDESISKLKVQEKIHEDTSKLNMLLANQIQEGDRKISTLKNESSNLAVKIKELVHTKENLKTEISAIQEQITKTEVESKATISAIVEDKTKQVKEQNKLVAAAQVELGQLKSEYNHLGIFNEAENLVQEQELLESIHIRTKTELERILDETETELDDTVVKLEDVERKRRNQISKRNKLIENCEKGSEELTCSLEKRTKKIEEEKLQQNVLEEEHEKLTKELAKIERRYMDEKYLICPDLLIEKLTADLDDFQAANEKAEKEFAAYQKHSEYLIGREQLLNKRFRMLSFRHDEEKEGVEKEKEKDTN